ncbi:uncharacterized protein METZ01_LOCUS475569, partial [marine metagenome]
MSVKTLILSALSCIFFTTTATAIKIVANSDTGKHKYPSISDVKKRIQKHTEPKYRNTFMI